MDVRVYGCESWTIKKAEHQRIDAFELLENTPESPLDCKEIKPVQNQPWIFTGRTDAEIPIIWLPDEKSRLTGKDSDAGKDRRQKKWVEEDEIVREHHWLNGMNMSKLQQTIEDSGVWWAAVLQVAKSWTWVSDWTTTIVDISTKTIQSRKNNYCIR